MAAQSGIQPSESLSKTWSDALASDSVRLIKVVIKNESLEPENVLESSGDSLEDQFELFGRDGVVDEVVPAYYLLRLEASSSSSWLFISYVPDSAPVRAKMLYASSRATCSRELGDSRFSSSIFATSKSDLTYESYLSHTRHEASAAPLTTREQEMADIKQAERRTQGDETPVQSEGVHGASMQWSDEAKAALQGLREDTDSKVVLLEIDTAAERVTLSSGESTSLKLPSSSPCYAFYRHAGGLVFIYSCPSGSPVKSRMIYASSVRSVLAQATSQGLQVVKKIETSEPDEVTDEFIASEIPTASSSGTSTPTAAEGKPAFARPSRPGRKPRN